ncbi:helix-turn-helix domain-containing protein [Pelagibacterium nitratireducens]|uniref:Helix-turn-helix domain-containing protein n=1 Tax=Pelagibacterium nitratireducens TaxID=1046114 RepID=A0ABZ2I0Q2_9HYPH
MVRYHDLAFQPDMLTARRDDGDIVRLTRQERALLLRLVRQPHALVTRTQVLEALGDRAGGVLSERNVDYLVNRLRRRLGDSAKQPRFIATQYGEGYCWIAEPANTEPLSGFLLVGPVFGVDQDSFGFPHRLTEAIKAAIGCRKSVLYQSDWRQDPKAPGAFDFTLDVSTHFEADRLHLALALRAGRSGQIIESFRRTVSRPHSAKAAGDLARTITNSVWRHEAMPGPGAIDPADRPAHLRLHDAAVMLTDDTISWRENAARLRDAHAADKSDPRLSLMLALNHYARLLQSLETIGDAPLGTDDWDALETEIESLSLRALPDAHGHPQQLLAIAKLLRFIDRGHLDLAERLTDEAFRNSTAFAAVFSMKAQIAASRGDIDAAAMLYDRAMEMAEPGSQFHIYLLILKSVAMMADDRRGAVDQLAVELHDFDPNANIGYGLFMASPNAGSLNAPQEDALAAISPEVARNLTSYLFRISARPFQRRTHQRNVMKGLTTHLVRHHGAGAIAPDIARRFPELVRASRKGRAR